MHFENARQKMCEAKGASMNSKRVSRAADGIIGVKAIMRTSISSDRCAVNESDRISGYSSRQQGTVSSSSSSVASATWQQRL
jgi:hypothetical protein